MRAPSRRGQRGALCAAWAACALGAFACEQPAPDVDVLAPMSEEDTRVVVLLREADRDSNDDPAGAARNIRELVLPRARANAAACAAARPRHPRAQAVASELCSLLEERASRVERYAAALEAGRPEGLLREVRAQRELERDMARADGRLRAAARAAPTRGCSRGY